MFAAEAFPVVVPGSVSAAPSSVAPLPRNVAVAPLAESTNVVPFGALPAGLLKDQRFTSAAFPSEGRSPESNGRAGARRIRRMGNGNVTQQTLKFGVAKLGRWMET
jgi:hypothetical protein